MRKKNVGNAEIDCRLQTIRGEQNERKMAKKKSRQCLENVQTSSRRLLSIWERPCLFVYREKTHLNVRDDLHMQIGPLQNGILG